MAVRWICASRYETFEELRQYRYRVASIVGLVSMHIIGIDAASPAQLAEATHCATQLGVALQMTNILRDVGEDLARGRVYLPQEDWRRFGYSEHDLYPQNQLAVCPELHPQLPLDHPVPVQ